MNLCKQRHTYDCFLAALTTLLQGDYDQLWPLEFQQRIEANCGSGGGMQQEAFTLVGLRNEVDYWQTPVAGKQWMAYLLRYFHGRPVLLQVPSLNNPGRSHLIVYHDDQVYDPSNLKTYDQASDIERVEWVTVFTHAALNRL